MANNKLSSLLLLYYCSVSLLLLLHVCASKAPGPGWPDAVHCGNATEAARSKRPQERDVHLENVHSPNKSSFRIGNEKWQSDYEVRRQEHQWSSDTTSDPHLQHLRFDKDDSEGNMHKNTEASILYWDQSASSSSPMNTVNFPASNKSDKKGDGLCNCRLNVLDSETERTCTCNGKDIIPLVIALIGRQRFVHNL